MRLRLFLLIAGSGLLLTGVDVRALVEDSDLPPDLVHQYVGTYFEDADHGYVYAADVITATADGGATWRVVYDGSCTDLFFLDGRTFWFFARGTDLYATRDGGQHFAVHPRPTYLDARSGERKDVSGHLFFTSVDDGWTVSVRDVLRTRDGGARWQAGEIPPGLGESHTIRMFDDREGIAIESFHPVLRTTDAGATWAAVPNSPRLSSLSCTTAGFCAGVAHEHGPVFFSGDRGRTWRDAQAPVQLPDRDRVFQVQALSPAFVALAGTHSDLSFQHDVRPFIGSRTPLPHHGPPTGLLLIWNGAQWTRITHDVPRCLRGLSFVSPKVGWLVSDADNQIFKTTDGGQTLTFVRDYFRQTAPPTPIPPDRDASSPQ